MKNTTKLCSQKFVSLLCAAVLSLVPVFSASAGGKNKSFSVSIENFGKINDHYYRGAQPAPESYAELAGLGIKTVIDLREDAKSYARSAAEKAGLHYINFPMTDKAYPRANAAQKFLELANNPENWPIYVHCAGGRHRTGIMTAVYRINNDGWDIDRAYNEMKQFDFYTSWGHEAMKDYIFDYYRDYQQHHPVGVKSTSVSVSQ